MCIFLSQTQWYGSRCPLRACSPGVSNQLSGHGWACTLLGAPKPVWSCCQWDEGAAPSPLPTLPWGATLLSNTLTLRVS